MTSKSNCLSTCYRHPSVPITGFCASCLSERLAGIQSPVAEVSHSTPPKLRRTKSCSGNRDASSDVSSAYEPRRWSCDVRGRSTLSDLFSVDVEKKKRRIRSGFEIGEVEEEHANEEGIRVCEEAEEEEETKTMKEFIDLELKNRKNESKDSKSLWHAASVLSNKLRKWTWKHKLKKKHGRFDGNGNESGNRNAGFKKPRARRYRETQSEVGEYELGRRSCDVGRISVDNSSRLSFDAPRASWDGYLIGNKASHRLSPMISVVEDENHRVLVVQENGSNNAASFSPGGSAQTQDYYSCRRSFDRSNSHRRKSIAEVDELKLMSSNAKVSPATTELFYGAKLLITEKELMDRNVKSLSDVQSDSVPESASKDDSDVATVDSQKGSKKLQNLRKVWNKLGLVQRKEDTKLECDAGGNMLNKPLAESWQKLRRVVNVQPNESVSQKLIRSYSVSCRNPCKMAGLINSLGAPEARGNVLNGRREFALQRNRSARYSPHNLDNGLLRFYLTPLKSYRRSKSGKSSL
ncbi:hypothetical protein TanjilG_24016 [Lupinus angustifolius]|uniref:Uncharacterized protein n=1 Tax=Lupinus angustifolius TaxID=3871 RepID=A0A1J7HLH4_LUPAN|nr:PREDICTED: UPF0503 protein At3g09070, chloroplastic-like [Lupinus angustifolius]OIW02565.1 hypothetical protein TanjilG_24016 [Lupinus angustifolius]